MDNIEEKTQLAIDYFASGKIVCPFAKGQKMIRETPSFQSPEFLNSFPDLFREFEASADRALILIPPTNWSDKPSALRDMKQLVFDMYVADDLIQGVQTSAEQALNALVANNPDFLDDTTDDIKEPIISVNNIRYFVSGLSPFYKGSHYRHFPCSIAVIVDFAEIEDIRNKSTETAQKIQLEAAARGYLSQFDNIGHISVQDVIKELGLWQQIHTMIKEGDFGVEMGENKIRNYIEINHQGQLNTLKYLLQQNRTFKIAPFIHGVFNNSSSLIV